MTAPHPPAAPPRARLALTAITLVCCLAVYVFAVPLLLRGGSVSWQLALVIAAALVASVGVIAVLWQMRGELAGSHEQLQRQAAHAAQRNQEIDRQADEISRQSSEISRQNLEISGHTARISELTAEVTRHREREEELLSECTRLRADAKEVREQATALEHAVRHTVTERIPNALMGGTVPPAEDDGVRAEIAALLAETVACATDAGAQQDSMRAAVVALSRRVQSSAHRIQEEATLMADRHPGNADVLEVSMRVDHAAAQQARTAQSMAVLLGERPGQQWADPLPLVDVVRAAAGRIIAYRRIEVVGDQDIAASAPVVEPLIHLVAELLANATQSSPPTTQVPVTVRAVQRGAVIEVHDCGVGLDDYRLTQARDIATGERQIGLEGLGEFPQTGLAVVGQYVRRHGFRVDISESVYGGVRAIVGVPSELTETVEPADAIPVQAAPAPEESRTATATATVTDAPPLARRTGIPRRVSPRRATGGATGGHPVVTPAAGTDSADSLAQPTPEEAGAWMGAFLTADKAGDEPASPGGSPATPGRESATPDDNSTGQQEQ